MRKQGWTLLAAALLVGGVANAGQVVLEPSQDNVLYEIADGSQSNGVGSYLFAGRTAQGADYLRRSVLAFDLSGLPAGATITNASLSMNMSRTIVGPMDVSLHEALADWGEGTSDAAGQEGLGNPPTTGDATWIHTFFPGSFWDTPGGDFDPVPSATTSVDQIGSYQWSGPQLVADVQGWIDSPATNFGWVLVGDESVISAKRFDSGDNATPELRPMLTIDFDGPSVPAVSGLGAAVMWLMLVAGLGVLYLFRGK
jgi:hypothetical protein